MSHLGSKLIIVENESIIMLENNWGGRGGDGKYA